MQHDFNIPFQQEADANAREIGELAISCTDVAGEMLTVSGSIATQLDALSALKDVISELHRKQMAIMDATDLTRSLSATTLDTLLRSNRTVTLSIAEFSQLTALVTELGTRMKRFNDAISKVGGVLGAIESIAGTTRMLALNATIEAARAGEAGRAFSVVAAEVKRLSLSTSAATETIKGTIEDLTNEAYEFVNTIELGVERSRLAEQEFSVISDAMQAASDLVGQVREQAADVAILATESRGSMSDVTTHVQELSVMTDVHAQAINKARCKVIKMEVTSNHVFNRAVQAGALTEDHGFVDISTRQRDLFVKLTEAALDDGSLDEKALFDEDYQWIPGSIPKRFTTMLNKFADAVWAPELERFVSEGKGVVSAACTDVNGYLPTCTSEYNRKPTGEYAHDDKWCRHGRILMDDLDKVSKASTAPFFLFVYRRTAGNANYQVARNVSVPMYLRGRRWGDFECSYVCD